MEITLLILMWLTVGLFTFLAARDSDNIVWPLIACIGFFYLSISLGAITYIGYNSQGQAIPYQVQAGDPKTEGIEGAMTFLRMVAIAFFLINVWWTYDRYKAVLRLREQARVYNARDPANPHGI